MYIILDIGGTKTRIGLCESLDESVEVIDKISTPQNPKTGIQSLKEVVDSAVGDQEIKGVAVAIAGVVNRSATRLLAAPNLSGWVDFPLAEKISELFGGEVVVVNDTDLGALGEAVEGAGVVDGITAYLTVGTGVGGGLVIDGELAETVAGFEPGHQIVEMSDFLSLGDNLPPEGKIPGHLEYYLSGANIERRTGKKAPEVKDESLWRGFQDRLVVALNNVAVMWSPDVIVLGGSMIIRNEFLSFAYMQKKLEKIIEIFPETPTIQRSTLQDNAGLVGARIYLKQSLQ